MRRQAAGGLMYVIAAAALSMAASCAPEPTAIGGSTMPKQRDAAREYATVVAGFVHTCALDSDGVAYCWGNNDYSQLGASTTGTCGGRACSTDPVQVRGGLRFTALAAGWVHNCGVDVDGHVWCWGGGGGSVDREGYLGDGPLRRSVDPVRVAADSSFVSVTIGDGHSCALTASGQAYCWGVNDVGQLGDYSRVDRPTLVPAAGSLRFRTLSAGAYHTCGVTFGGEAYCWGDNRWGQLGAGDVPYNSVESARHGPVPVSGGGTWTHIAAGWQHTCGIGVDGVTHCWGRNDVARQLGDDSDVTHRGTPAPVSGGRSFISLSAGPLATCGRTPTGETWCWGANYYGALGDGSVAAAGVGRPVRVQGGPFVEITLGQSHSCALNGTRALWCWGDRSAGQY